MNKKQEKSTTPLERGVSSKTWIVSRYVVEKYTVQAESRTEALNTNFENPYSVTITKETCVEDK